MSSGFEDDYVLSGYIDTVDILRLVGQLISSMGVKVLGTCT